MFLVSKDGNKTAEVNLVEVCYGYEDKIAEEAQRIHMSTTAKAYNFGSTKRAEEEADRRVEDYLSNKKKIGRIYVNDKLIFGDYDERQGKIVFENILAALKNGEQFFDMREVDFGDV